MSQTLEKIVDSIVNFNHDSVMANVKVALSEGLSPQEIIEEGISKGLRIVGKKYEDGELFLVHLIAAAEPSKRKGRQKPLCDNAGNHHGTRSGDPGDTAHRHRRVRRDPTRLPGPDHL